MQNIIKQLNQVWRCFKYKFTIPIVSLSAPLFREKTGGDGELRKHNTLIVTRCRFVMMNFQRFIYFK